MVSYEDDEEDDEDSDIFGESDKEDDEDTQVCYAHIKDSVKEMSDSFFSSLLSNLLCLFLSRSEYGSIVVC